MRAQTNQSRAAGQSPATPQAPQADPTVNVMSKEDVQHLRDQIRQGIRAGLNAETQDGSDAAPVVVSTGQHNITVRDADGKQTVVTLPNTRDMIPPQAVDISVAFFIMVAAIIIGLPIARAFGRRMDRSAARMPVAPEVSAQLTQLNQAVDAIALEVERISEGQRYTTRLLSEQRDPSQQTLATRAER